MPKIVLQVTLIVDDAELEKLNGKRRRQGRAVTTAEDEAVNTVGNAVQHNYLFDDPKVERVTAIQDILASRMSTIKEQAQRISDLEAALTTIIKGGPRCDECSSTLWVIHTAESALAQKQEKPDA